MVFKPGESGNLQGAGLTRTRLTKQLSDKLIEHVPSAVQVITDALKSAKSDDKQWAAEIVLNRVYGKAPESLEISGPDGGPLAIMKDMPATVEEFSKLYAPKLIDGE